MDVLEDIQTFASEGYGIVFYSYQWSAALEWWKAAGGSWVRWVPACGLVLFQTPRLSWTHKGPNGVQREWMDSAVRHYSERSHMPTERLHIWLDILAIPQRNREVQKLAVDSLCGTRDLAAVAVSGDRGACCERPVRQSMESDWS